VRGVCIVNDGSNARVGVYECVKVFARMHEVLSAVYCVEYVILCGACCMQWIAWLAPGELSVVCVSCVEAWCEACTCECA
jgi:hypothetical protein